MARLLERVWKPLRPLSPLTGELGGPHTRLGPELQDMRQQRLCGDRDPLTQDMCPQPGGVTPEAHCFVLPISGWVATSCFSAPPGMSASLVFSTCFFNGVVHINKLLGGRLKPSVWSWFPTAVPMGSPYSSTFHIINSFPPL